MRTKFYAPEVLSALVFFAAIVGCASKGGAARASRIAQNQLAAQPVDAFVQAQEQKSWELLHVTISPQEPKVPGGRAPRPGIVVAALQKSDPDYYFHWVRDSSNVMRTLIEYTHDRQKDAADLHKKMRDFLRLSSDLQALPSAYGLGEPRYTVEGKVDTLPWSRPQYDGPALRALAVMKYLELYPSLAAEQKRLAERVLRKDLDYVAKVRHERGFDIWEELKAENYHTSLVQLSALEKAAKFYPSKNYGAAASELVSRLNDHWDPTRHFLRSQLAIEKTDGYSKKQTDLDSAAVLAVMESDRREGPHSVLDPRVQATVFALENLFKEIYPLNQDKELGLAYGRYRGDVYFGGNPWFLITAYYAQYYYRLADLLVDRDFEVTAVNLDFTRSLLPQQTPASVGLAQTWKKGSAAHANLLAACMKRGDSILARIRAHMPSDGQFYEQMDKKTGLPVSSRGIGWAHSAFLAAALERANVVKKLPSP